MTSSDPITPAFEKPENGKEPKDTEEKLQITDDVVEIFNYLNLAYERIVGLQTRIGTGLGSMAASFRCTSTFLENAADMLKKYEYSLESISEAEGYLEEAIYSSLFLRDQILRALTAELLYPEITVAEATDSAKQE